ncbi:MAG: magnesium/cobalt transporter CorA [bacterium]
MRHKKKPIHGPRQRVRKFGAPPGTLIHTGEQKLEQPKITAIHYNEQKYHEEEIADLRSCLKCMDPGFVSWINLSGLHRTEYIQEVGNQFQIHDLVLEDILHTEHRPKIEDYDTYLFMTLRVIFPNANAPVPEQISLVLTSHAVITFQESDHAYFQPVLQRINTVQGRFRKLGADYLAYVLLDTIVDGYLDHLEETGNEIEALEEELTNHPSAATIRTIHRLRREIIELRRWILPVKDITGYLIKSQSPLIQPYTKIYLGDVQDHTIQSLDTLAAYQEILGELTSQYHSILDNRMNEIMAVLTVFAAIFIPLSFLAGVYGMNFEYMPELKERWSYPVFWVIVITVITAMVGYFKRKKWI